MFSSQISSHKDSLELELLPAVNTICSRYTGLQHSNSSVNLLILCHELLRTLSCHSIRGGPITGFRNTWYLG